MMNGNSREYAFLTALARLNTDYSITLNRDDFIESAYPIWKSIGNNQHILKYGKAKVPSDLMIDLPSDCKFVDNVTIIDRANYTDNRHGYDSTGLKQLDTYDKGSSDVLAPQLSDSYLAGTPVNYDVNGSKLIIKDSYLENSNILYTYSIIEFDSDSLPKLNEKEVKAIAAGVAYKFLTKQAFKGTLTQQQVQIYKIIKDDSERLLQAAAIPEQISSAGMDKILDATVSSDRKLFGRKYI